MPPDSSFNAFTVLSWLCVCLLTDTDYEAHKAKAEQANQYKEELFEEAKHLGGVGDRNADSHLRQLEKRLEVCADALLSALHLNDFTVMLSYGIMH